VEREAGDFWRDCDALPILPAASRMWFELEHDGYRLRLATESAFCERGEEFLGFELATGQVMLFRRLGVFINRAVFELSEVLCSRSEALGRSVYWLGEIAKTERRVEGV
tara:strand:+ start:784 stop:1110 length:327 start_codon:yes stop_codon:yes gene_type:complete